MPDAGWHFEICRGPRLSSIDHLVPTEKAKEASDDLDQRNDHGNGQGRTTGGESHGRLLITAENIRA
jgi:hypothetical protein